MPIFFNRMLWNARQCLTILSIWGLIGIGLMGLAGSIVYGAYSTSSQLQADKRKVAMEQAAKLQKIDHSSPSQMDPNIASLLAFITLLPEEQSLPTILKQMYKQAKINELPIASADYKWRKIKKNTAFAAGNLAQYEITFTVKGSYDDIRNTINALLVQTPTLALDSLELKREDVTSTLTEAKLTFVVYLIGRDE